MTFDLQQLQRCLATGDALAFQELVLAHQGMVIATARRITQDDAPASDAGQAN